MVIEKANYNHIDRIMGIIESAKAYLKSQGHDQWQNGYPARDDIVKDIASEAGYVMKDGDDVFGYCALIFTGEPCYNTINGAWLNDEPYAVIHRMAISGGRRGKGLGVLAFSEIEKLVTSNGFSSIRVDTHDKNKVMQHVIERSGFTRCGLVMLADGERIAFQKVLL